LEFEVESQLEGRPIAQLASIIVNQVNVHCRLINVDCVPCNLLTGWI